MNNSLVWGTPDILMVNLLRLVICCGFMKSIPDADGRVDDKSW